MNDEGRKSKRINFKLYLITDRKIFHRPSRKGTLSPRDFTSSIVNAVEKALKGGVKAVQLREKDLSTRQLLKLAYRMRELTEKFDAKLFINDRLDIALAVSADGVHLTQNSMPADAVRRVVKKAFLIGVSTHSLKEARQAEEAGADFVTFGPVYRTSSKLRYGRPLGLNVLKRIVKKIKAPVFAIGGIKSGRIKDVKKAGANGVAMISEIFKAAGIQNKANEIINLLEDR